MKPVSGLESELILLMQAFLSGIILSLVYDSIRIFRRFIPHGIVWISVEDLLYWLIAGGWLFLRVCCTNDGIIRGYMLIGIAVGALLYYRLCGRFIMHCLTKWIIRVKKRLKRGAKAVTIKADKVHRNQETENEEKKKETP